MARRLFCIAKILQMRPSCYISMSGEPFSNWWETLWLCFFTSTTAPARGSGGTLVYTIRHILSQQWVGVCRNFRPQKCSGLADMADCHVLKSSTTTNVGTFWASAFGSSDLFHPLLLVERKIPLRNQTTRLGFKVDQKGTRMFHKISGASPMAKDSLESTAIGVVGAWEIY